MMTLRSTLLAVLRHRIIVLVGLVATIASVYVATSRIASEYVANASFVLLAPSETVDSQGSPARINPYIRLGSSGEGLVASTLLGISRSQQFSQQMVEAGATSDFAVALAPDGGGVVMGTTVTDTTAPGAMRSLGVIRAQLEEELRRQQEAVNAPAGSFLRLQVVTADQVPVELTGSRTRAAAAMLAVGIGATVSAALWAERNRTMRPGAAIGAHTAPFPAPASRGQFVPPQPQPSPSPEEAPHRHLRGRRSGTPSLLSDETVDAASRPPAS